MSVTNEQIDAIRICHSQLQCSDCKYNKTLDDCDPDKLQIASDLLDARELIEKQEALIKEMRKCLSDIKYTPWLELRESTQGDMNNLLEKTREYAE